MATDSTIPDTDFPQHGILPKKETGAWNFITKYPDFDGRGTIIAIADSGVDPGANGLQVTSTGEPKILDIYDATGSGDVDTSKVVQAKERCIVGLSGRELKIPETWNNPSGDYHIGIKDGYSIFPPDLVSRIKKLRADKHKQEKNPMLVEADANHCKFIKDLPSGTLPKAASLKMDELAAQKQLLEDLEGKVSDPGPVYDCVVFHDGDTWRACVDTSENGDLDQCKLLANYREERQYSTFSAETMLNYVLNIHEDGNILEICVNGSHGTHVAGITAAFHSAGSERNGVAPGAQLISIKLGDTRLGMSEETGPAFMRTMIRVLEWKCDLVNISFGESTRWPNDGRVTRFMADCVLKHNIQILSSAGNGGPALSTVGCPGATMDYIIGVGAYVSPEMMAAEYSLREKRPETVYNWTSCGPSLDGEPGVTISAPGGAITSVPTWTLHGTRMMNGTSMSSPNCTGCVALVLSALKQQGVPYTTSSTQRAMRNTAKKIANTETLAIGAGLIQVEKMYDYMMEYNSLPEDNVFFKIMTDDGNRGVYIREPAQYNSPLIDYTVQVDTKFISKYQDGETLNTDEQEQRKKIDFCKSLVLTCSEPWISASRYLEVMNTPRSFQLRVDHSGLSPGAHYAEVNAYDVSCVEKGPLFRFPVTVAVPDKINNVAGELGDNEYMLKRSVNFHPGTKIRHFLHVPRGATYMLVKISCDPESRTLVYLHCLTLEPGQSTDENDNYGFYAFQTKGQNSKTLPVMENTTVEVCLSRWWSNSGNAKIDYEISFDGVTVDNRLVSLHAGRSVEQINVTSHLKRIFLDASANLTTQVVPIRPSTYSMNLLSGPRDKLPDNRLIYGLELEYNFKVKACEVIVTFPLLSEVLYESPYESQLWQLYDSNKRYIRSGDAFPIKYKYSSKLESGSYVIRLLVRHEDREALEAIKKHPVELHFAVPSIPLSVYPTQKDAITNGRRFKSIPLKKGGISTMFIACPPDDKFAKLPMSLCAGSYLCGKLTFTKETFDIRFNPMDECKVTDAKAYKPTPTPEESNNLKYQDALSDYHASWIQKLTPSDEALSLYARLSTDSPATPLPIHLAGLQVMLSEVNSLLDKTPGNENDTASSPAGDAPDNHETGEATEQPLIPEEKLKMLVNDILKITDSLLGNDEIIDKPALLAYFGLAKDTSDEADKVKKEMTKKRDRLVELMVIRLDLMSSLLTSESQLMTSLDIAALNVSVETFNALAEELLKYAKQGVQTKKTQALMIKYYKVNKCPALMVKTILDNSKGQTLSKDQEEQLIKLYTELRWSHLIRYAKDALLLKFPPAYLPF